MPGDEAVIPAVVGEIREQFGALRAHLDEALDDLRARLDGKSKPLLTVEEVAELTGRAPYTVRSWISEGLISATRVNGTGPKGRLLVPRDELRRLVEAGRGRRLALGDDGGS